MRKISGLFILLNLIVSCSSDEKLELPASNLPTNITLSSQVVEIGETLQINGVGFLANENYVITFTENIRGKIVEIDSDFLKVEIPENAQSGNISLTFNKKTIIIGSVEITPVIHLYCYKRETGANSSIHQLIKVNKNTGTQSLVSNLDLNPSGYFQDLVYDSDENSIYGAKSADEILKINLTSLEITTISLNNPNDDFIYEELVFDSIGNLYCYKREIGASSSIHQLIKVDKNSGAQSLISNLDLDPFGYFQDLVYNSDENTIYGSKSTDEILKINLTNLEVTTISLNNPNDVFIYEELVFDGIGNLYCYKREIGASSSIHQLIKVNTNTGGQSLVSNLELNPSSYFHDLTYDSVENSLYGTKSRDEILKINLTSQEGRTISLDNPNENLIYGELIFID